MVSRDNTNTWQKDAIFSEENQKPLTVTQLTRRIKNALERTFPVAWVEGELSNVALPRSGHLYFVLKDTHAQVKAVMFRSSYRRLQFKPEDGQQVIVSGNITVYEARGDYQIIVSYMEPKGTGALQIAFEQLKKKLSSEGLFDASRKKPLPLFPHKIGVVTSATGAAIHDILNVLKRRFSNVHILLYPAKVQGNEASQEIIQGIKNLDKRRDVDVIIVGRGGGSIEDLWPFNEESVARAIFEAETPLISAVGHETDFTIADFVADVRAPTPSAAAELVVKNKDDLKNQLAHFTKSMISHVLQKIETNDTFLRSLSSRPFYREPARYFQERQLRLDDTYHQLLNWMSLKMQQLQSKSVLLHNKLISFNPIAKISHLKQTGLTSYKRLNRAMQVNLEKAEHSFGKTIDQLNALSPLAHLKRGYTIVLSHDQKVILKQKANLKEHDRIWIQFVDGRAFCEIKHLTPEQLWRLEDEERKT